ncbi:MAG: ABC transporter substrate-binding protein [Spirochaetes bacterium]|nr:ABC transporter substrate-binding protein [Spirochaetota bacterium]
MKKAVKIIITAVMISAVFACASKKMQGKIKIGISKIVSHPALDAVEQGIQDELKEQGIDAEFDLQNANGDVNTAASIAAKFKAEGADISVGIATPTAQALVNAIKDKPVIYAAVTDPVSAGLVASFTEGGENVTGVSDMTPVKEQLVFLSKIKKIKTVGHIYSSHEDNAVALAKIVKASCDELGIELVESTISNSSEVKQAAQSIAGRVDAFYVSTDNTVVSALSSLVDVADKNSIPVMSADPSSAESIGVLAAWGFDYYKMGRATGRMIAEIINGKECSDIPTMFLTDPKDIDLLINKDVAKKLNLEFPSDVEKNAASVVENGKLEKK